jgi:hypothetical protein
VRTNRNAECRFESVAAVCARWQRRYKRLGMGIVRRPTHPKNARSARESRAIIGAASERKLEWTSAGQPFSNCLKSQDD